MHRLIPAVWASLVVVGLLSAQTILPIAHVQEGSIYITRDGQTTPVSQSQTPFNSVSALQWSPDGTRLAYVDSVPRPQADFTEYVSQLVVTDANGANPITLAEKLFSGLPISWMADGRILYASDNPNNRNATSPDGFMVDLFAVDPSTGTITALASVPFGVGCGGGSSFPPDWRYWEESHSFGGNHLMLQETPFGIVFSTNCGGVGLNLLKPDASIVTISDTLARTRVAADGRLIGIDYQYAETGPITQLAVVDLASLAVTLLDLPFEIEQVAWGADNNTAYVTNVVAGPVIATPEQNNVLYGIVGFSPSDAPTSLFGNAVTVFRVDLTTALATEVYRAEAFNIGKLVWRDGTLYFSQVGNAEAWVEALLNGTVDVMSEQGYAQQAQLIPVTLMALNTVDNSVSTVGAFNQFALGR